MANRSPALSTIDHFAASSRVFQCVLEAGVIHSSMNQSNHSAIFQRWVSSNTGLEDVKSEKKIAREKATYAATENYKCPQSEKFSALPSKTAGTVII